VTRTCTICSHDEAHAIDVAIVQQDTYRSIAERWGVSHGAIRRHRQEHLPALLARAKEAVEVAQADSLLERVEGLYKRTETILDTVEESQEWGLALSAIRECRSNLELLGRVTKELESAPTLNLTLNPEYLEVRAIIVQALGPYPDARQAVADALAAHDGG
jgi:hypothetical protein